MAIKKTLLEIVQAILSDMDSEPVNSIADTTEADQIVTIVENAYYDIIGPRDDVPEQKGFIKLTAASDNLFPTHFRYPDNVTDIEEVWYDHSKDSTFDYRRVVWCDPLVFVKRLDKLNSDFTNVKDKEAGTNLRIQNNKFPEYYTSFDDYWIVMDSHHATYDDTLQESKVRAFGRTFPIFDRNDDGYIMDVDAEYHAYILAEARSRAMDWFKGGTTRKAEEASRRNKSYIQNDKHRTKQPNNWSTYGRR